MIFSRSARLTLLLVAAVAALLIGCDEASDSPIDGGALADTVDSGVDADASVDDAPSDTAADVDSADVAEADADDDSAAAALRDGLWSMGVSFAELGGLEIAAQLELSGVSATEIGEVGLRFVGDDGVASEVIVSAAAVPYDEAGFVADFGEFTLPAAYSPTGSEVGLALALTATGVSAELLCGTVTGEVIDFGIDVTRSTFGAIPWDEQPGQALPLNCDWEPGVVIERETRTIGTEARPARLDLPAQFDAEQTWPIVVVLHGFGATGVLQAQYFGLNTLIDEIGYLLIIPDGTTNADGEQFWNATAACCGFGSDVDDQGYLTGLVDEVVAEHAGDPDRVYFIGHSNGGFMSHRLACERPDLIAGVVSLAGAGTRDDQDCQPDAPVGIVNIHGTADATIEFEGRSGALGFPSAVELTARWARLNGCTGALGAPTAADYEPSIAGDETERQQVAGCPVDGPVSLWTVNEGSHIPAFDSVPLTRDAFAELGLRGQ